MGATIAETRGFVHDLRERAITPHVAINAHLTKTGKRRTTFVDGRTLRHAGNGISQRCRKRVEEVSGWLKTTGGIARVKVRGDWPKSKLSLPSRLWPTISFEYPILRGQHER